MTRILQDKAGRWCVVLASGKQAGRFPERADAEALAASLRPRRRSRITPLASEEPTD